MLPLSHRAVQRLQSGLSQQARRYSNASTTACFVLPMFMVKLEAAAEANS
jgi:hypothetical protein